jgi:hypothetical protein
MKNLSSFSRRDFVALAAAGLSLVGPRGVFALGAKASAG